MPTTGIKLGRILVGIKNRLIDRGIYTPSTCKLALRMNVPQHSVGRDYAIILPLMQTHDQNSKAGQGRDSPIVIGRINVYGRHQNAQDQSYYDDIWMAVEDGDGGFLGELAEIEDALDLWNPSLAELGAGSATYPAFLEPMRAVFANEPRKDYGAPEWGEGMVEIEVQYRAWRRN